MEHLSPVKKALLHHLLKVADQDFDQLLNYIPFEDQLKLFDILMTGCPTVRQES